MSEANGTDTERHLREALRHLGQAQDDDTLRKTNAVALEEVSNTVSSVLRASTKGTNRTIHSRFFDATGRL